MRPVPSARLLIAEDKVLRYAVVLGRATEVWSELDAAKKLIGQHPIHVIAVKRAARDYDGPVHEWPSFHPELFASWMEERAKHNRPAAKRLWCARSKHAKHMDSYGLPINWLVSVGGSSGLLGVQVGFAIGHPPYNQEPPIDKMILCGIPMEKTGRYDDKKVWQEAEIYRDHWIKFFNDDPTRKDKVRSMSGWTRALLGAPTVEWLHGTAAA